MAAKRASEPDLLTIAFELVAEGGWAGLSLTGLAARADVPLVELYRRLPGRRAILAGLARRVDEAMLAIDRAELEDLPVRDRLFELIMRRFDALAPFRAGLARLAADARRDPGVVMLTLCRLDRSMRWVQELAGLRAHGLRARLQRRALMAVYLRALRVWLADEGGDHAKTMAEVDTLLRRCERLAGLVEPRRKADSGEAAQPA